MNCPQCKYFMHRRDEIIDMDGNGNPIFRKIDYCDKCGIKYDSETKKRIEPISYVKNRVSTNNEMIVLKCEHCQGSLELGSNPDILFCPYCGSKLLLPVSDLVKIERIKQSTEIRKAEIKQQQSANIFNGLAGIGKKIFKGCLMYYVFCLFFFHFFISFMSHNGLVITFYEGKYEIIHSRKL